MYVATGKSMDVLATDGKFLGTIPGRQGLRGTFFGGKDRKTLFGIVFYGMWGTPKSGQAGQVYSGERDCYRMAGTLCGPVRPGA